MLPFLTAPRTPSSARPNQRASVRQKHDGFTNLWVTRSFSPSETLQFAIIREPRGPEFPKRETVLDVCAVVLFSLFNNLEFRSNALLDPYKVNSPKKPTSHPRSQVNQLTLPRAKPASFTCPRSLAIGSRGRDLSGGSETDAVKPPAAARRSREQVKMPRFHAETCADSWLW